jgi:RNA polymerase sigma factor for flagellar operon FliA
MVTMRAEWDEYREQHSPRVRERLILQYGPLVKYVIGRIAIGLPTIVDQEDVVSFGTIGLIEAVERFDASKGVKFETYAITRIRGAIFDALRALDRLPRSVRTKARGVERARGELTAQLGRSPTDVELASTLGITPPALRQIVTNASWVTVSLDGLLDGTGDAETNPRVEALPIEHAECMSDEIEHVELVRALASEVDRLPEREKLVVALYYQESLTMREIGAVLELSGSRVWQLHAKALSRLRAGLGSHVESTAGVSIAAPQRAA